MVVGVGQSFTAWIFVGSALICPFSTMKPKKETESTHISLPPQIGYSLGDVAAPNGYVTRVKKEVWEKSECHLNKLKQTY